MTRHIAKQKWSQVELRVRRAGSIARNGLPFGLAYVSINQDDTAAYVLHINRLLVKACLTQCPANRPQRKQLAST
jgi:hypothetical protein